MGKSVLENHHLYIAYTILENENCNILSKLSKDEWEYFRYLVVEMVLATDMAEHFSQLNEIKNTLSSMDADKWKLIALGKAQYPEQLEKPKIMSLMIHAADISNALKPWHFSHYSTMQLLQEFFIQGDMCKMNRMPPSILCDRKTTKIPGSQINFSKFLVLPTFELLTSSVKLLAEVFLPTSIDDEKKKPTQRNQTSLLTTSLSVSTPTGLGLPTGVKLFRKESLRPDTTNTVCAKEVLAECRQFEEIWTAHMETNRDRWIEEQEKEAAIEAKQLQKT